MDKEAQSSYFGKILKQEIDKMTALQPGNKAPDFRFDAEKISDNGKIEKDYAFGGLPYFVFISPDSKIIARDFHEAFYAAKKKMEVEFGK